MFSYPGSKRRELKYFDHDIYFPSDENKYTFVDVFGGASNVMLHTLEKYSNVECVYNDIDSTVYNITNSIVNDYPEFCEEIKLYILNERTVREIDSLRPEIQFFIKGKIGYCGNRESTGRQPIRKTEYGKSLYDICHMERLAWVSEQRHRISLFNEDYTIILEGYHDDENALLFLDPPYCKKTGVYRANRANRGNQGNQGNRFSREDYQYIYDYLQTCKCRVLMVIDASEENVQLFKDYIRYQYYIHYSMGKLSKKETSHIVIYNYP